MNDLNPSLKAALKELAHAGALMSEAGQAELIQHIKKLQENAKLLELRAALKAAEAEGGAHDGDDVRAFAHAYLDSISPSGQA